MAAGCACKVIAGLYHVWQVTPSVGGRIPGDHAVTDREVDVATSEYPSAVVNTGGGRGAARREIGDRAPSVGVWIVAPCYVRGSVAATCIDIVTQSSCHQGVVGKWIIGSHGPAVSGNIVNLHVKIGTDSSTCDAIDFAVQVRGGMEVGWDSVRG